MPHGPNGQHSLLPAKQEKLTRGIPLQLAPVMGEQEARSSGPIATPIMSIQTLADKVK